MTTETKIAELTAALETARTELRALANRGQSKAFDAAWLKRNAAEDALDEARLALRDKPAAADWNHRADLDQWQDDFAGDFEECN
jgi:hypothetical protein